MNKNKLASNPEYPIVVMPGPPWRVLPTAKVFAIMKAILRAAAARTIKTAMGTSVWTVAS